jgi:hypothetical protein
VVTGAAVGTGAYYRGYPGGTGYYGGTGPYYGTGYYGTGYYRRGPLCRPKSDCWDVVMRFFDPAHRMDRALDEYRLTVDVNDISPRGLFGGGGLFGPRWY